MTVGTNAIGSWSMAEDQPGMIACYTNGIKTLLSIGKLVSSVVSVHDSCSATALSWDGALIATGASAGSNDVKLWDVKTGSRVGPDLRLGEGVAGLAFSPDAKYLVCGTVESKFHVFDATTFKEVNVLSNHTANVHRLAFIRTGTRLASGSTDSHIRVWSFPECNEIAHLTGHQGLVGDIAFSPDGQWLASGGTDHTVRLWNMDRPGIATLLRGHRGNVTSVLFSRDGKELYTACDDGTVKVWQVPSMESTNILRHSQWLNDTAFSPKGTLLAVEDQHARTTVLWDLPSRQRITNLVQHGAGFGVGRASFSPNGELLATAGQDAIAQVWNLPERKMIFEFPKALGSASLAFHPSKPILAVGWRDLRFWDLTSGKQMNLLDNTPDETVRRVAFSPDGERIALGLKAGNASIWSLATRRERHSFVNNLETTASTTAFCFSHDGTWLAAGIRDGRIALYDMRRQQRVTLLKAHLMHVTGLAFDPDDRALVSTSFDGTVKFWYVANQQLALTLSH